MSLVGPQNFWVVGSKCRFKRLSTEAKSYPLKDLGTISTVEPAIEVTKIELNDPGCGILTKVDEAVTQIDETYVLTLRNFAPDIAQYLFLSDEPEEYTRTDTPVTDGLGDHAFAGEIVQVLDSLSEAQYNLKSVEAVSAGSDVVSVDVAPGVGSQTMTFKSNLSLAWAIADSVVLVGNAFAGPVTINAIAYDAATDTTTITVDEDIATATAAGNGSVLKVLGTDWQIDALDFGTICIITGGSIDGGAPLLISYTSNAISGKRSLKPQSSAIIRGEIQIFFNRENCEEVSVRRAQCTLAPTAFDTAGTEDFASWQLTVSVLSTPEEILAGDGVGKMIYVKGDMPTANC